MRGPATITSSAEWKCSQGHKTEVHLIRLEEGKYIGGSSWDFCRVCDENPTPEAIGQAMTAIFDAELEAGIITTERREELRREKETNPYRNVHERIAEAIEKIVEGRYDGPANFQPRPPGRQ